MIELANIGHGLALFRYCKWGRWAKDHDRSDDDFGVGRGVVGNAVARIRLAKHGELPTAKCGITCGEQREGALVLTFWNRLLLQYFHTGWFPKETGDDRSFVAVLALGYDFQVQRSCLHKRHRRLYNLKGERRFFDDGNRHLCLHATMQGQVVTLTDEIEHLAHAPHYRVRGVVVLQRD